MELTNNDIADILALLDSLPYDSLDLQTASFRLTLRRTPDGWTAASQVLSEPVVLEAGGSPVEAETTTMSHRGGHSHDDGPSLRTDLRADGADGVGGRTAGSGGEVHEAGRADGDERELVAVRAPLPGTFYRAPRPGAEPFVAVGSRVSAETVVCIVETMKLMNSVHAGVDGVVAEICLGNAGFAASGATLMRIEAD
ncbi:MAG: acetyl-CoA carboxylase biotin carboxyl carrier protein [Streptosporangiaceae bacterium]